jgi:enolase
MSDIDKIQKVGSRYIYDSRGNPTVEVDVWTSKGKKSSICWQKHFFTILLRSQH